MYYLSLVIVILFWSNDFAFGASKANKGANDDYTVPLHIYQFKYRLDNTNNDKTKHDISFSVQSLHTNYYDLTQSYQHEKEPKTHSVIAPTLLNDIFAVILLSTLFVIIWLLSAIKCSFSNTTFIYCVIISINTNIAHSSNHYGIWRTNGPLPRAGSRAAVAYDNTNDTIYLIGGSPNPNHRQLLIISIKNNTILNDYGTSELAADIFGFSQYWTQIGDILWTVEYAGNYFVTFNVKTLSVQTQPQTPTIPNNAYNGCLTSIVGQQHIYLIVISGVTVQIYNHSSGEWLSNIPSMQTSRTYFPCLVHNNMLYAIGGYRYIDSIDSIEVLNVDNLENLLNWYFIDNLLSPLYGHRAVIYDDDILVLGGYCNTCTGHYNAQINVINTLTNTVTSGGFLNYASSWAAAIVVYPIIYLFSGYYDGNDVDTWQINTDVEIYTTTSDPTIDPTLPSLSPTMVPSQKPTSNPSNAPSNAPSSTPSFPPSIAPSSTPTYVPFASPSNFPTVAPSQFPTTNPTDAPTKSPTKIPLIAPTSQPTVIPTVIPTFQPTAMPTLIPSLTPTLRPTAVPTLVPSLIPTINPSVMPSSSPTKQPTLIPTFIPSSSPTILPTILPTIYPSIMPTSYPTFIPSLTPTPQPTAMPTFIPSLTPTTNETEESISKMAGEHSENSYLFIIGTAVLLVLVLFIVICIMCLVVVKLKKKSDVAQEQPHSDGYDQIELSLGNINAMNVDVGHGQRRTDILVANDNDNGSGQSRDSNYEQIRNGSDKSDSEQLFVPIIQNDETKNEIEAHLNNNLNEENKTNPFKTWFEAKINIPNSKNIYYQLFVDNGYETVEIVQFLTRNKLQNMGITKAGHIDKIMMEIEDLKKRSEVEGNAVSEGIDGSNTGTDKQIELQTLVKYNGFVN